MDSSPYRDPWTNRRPVTGLAEELARGVDGRGGVVEAAHPGDKQTHHLVPDELVDDCLSIDEDLGGDLVKRLSKDEKSRGAMPSAMPVEPRTSANNIDSSISAPPWLASMSW